MVVALNMMDVVRKSGDVIDAKKLGDALGCTVVETSALKGQGSLEAARKAAETGREEGDLRAAARVCGQRRARAGAHRGSHHPPRRRTGGSPPTDADGSVHPGGIVDDHLARWYAIKLFERDEKVVAELNLPAGIRKAIEDTVKACEQEMDDDAESIITNQRYAYIARLVSTCVKKRRGKNALTPSDKIDRIVTNRWLALPIFAVIMAFVYYISVTTIGTIVTDFTNDVFVASWIQEPAMAWLESIGTAPWLVGLIGDGIIAGVGAVLGFVPQMLVLFFLLAILEDVGYMARIAFIMDRIFRKFGLSGKSFIPVLIGTGCGVPGIMASRTIEQDRDRKMTIMTTTFIPCGAKLPIIALISGALFHNAWWVGTSAYFIGIAAIVRQRRHAQKRRAPSPATPAPFVMELPAYHAPSAEERAAQHVGARLELHQARPARSSSSPASSSGRRPPTAGRPRRPAADAETGDAGRDPRETAATEWVFGRGRGQRPEHPRTHRQRRIARLCPARLRRLASDRGDGDGFWSPRKRS